MMNILPRRAWALVLSLLLFAAACESPAAPGLDRYAGEWELTRWGEGGEANIIIIIPNPPPPGHALCSNEGARRMLTIATDGTWRFATRWPDGCTYERPDFAQSGRAASSPKGLVLEMDPWAAVPSVAGFVRLENGRVRGTTLSFDAVLASGARVDLVFQRR